MRSGRRIASVSTLDKLCSHADTVSLRAIKDESIPLLDRAKLAMQVSLKQLADKSETVTVNLSLTDELMRRIMARLDMKHEAAELPPPDIYITPVIEPNDVEPNEPNETMTDSTPSRPDQPPSPSTP